MRSCLYEGRVRHRRFAPTGHAFSYRIYYAYLDLDELDTVFAGRWLWSTRRPAPAWFRRADHLGPSNRPLKEVVLDLVERETGHRPRGPVRLLSQLRHFGYVFNPVSFYYCYDAAGESLEAIAAEVNNTPWGERHVYVLPRETGKPASRRLRFELDKRFHVSPFMPMDIHYRWHFTVPGERLGVHMENHRGGGKVFDATVALRREPIGALSCTHALARFPLMSARIIAAIYWQALKLLLKGVPVHDHPSKPEHSPGGAGTARS